MIEFGFKKMKVFFKLLIFKQLKNILFYIMKIKSTKIALIEAVSFYKASSLLKAGSFIKDIAQSGNKREQKTIDCAPKNNRIVQSKKKAPHCCEAFYIQKISRNYFFSDFSILAFNAANKSLLSPKVAAGAFVEELDEVFSVAAFTFFSSSSRKIAV